MSVINRIVGRVPQDTNRFDRKILTGMIISDEFLKGILPIYNDNLQIPFAKTVGRWIIEYYEKYQQAPKQNIESIFKDKRDSFGDPDEADMVEEFLTGLSSEYANGENFNSDYVLDKAEVYLREISLKETIKNAQKALVGGRIDEAEALVKGFERVSRIKTQGVDPIFDTNIISSSINKESGDALFRFPGALGEQVGDLKRGWLVPFIGSSGTGKTWWLMYTALRALFSGLNVVFISMEMSEGQMVERIQHYITGLPSERWAGELKIPVINCLKNQNKTCRRISKDKYCKRCIGTNEFEFGTSFKVVTKKELTSQAAVKKSKALRPLLRGNSFKLVTFPSRTATMNDINAYLYNLEHYENFIPDVIVTDYADKIKPEDGRDQYRHQLGKIWEAHKALAQQKKCLVVTASQSNTARTGKDVKQGSWSEAISKLELSDVAIALNSSKEDKERGIMRCVVAKQRHDEFSLDREIGVLYSFKIGKAYLDSVILPKKKKDDENKN